MKTTILKHALSVSLLIALASYLSPLVAEETAPWKINGRTLPPPAGASDVIRNAIANAPTPSYEARTTGLPSDPELRKKMRNDRDAASAIRVKERAAQFNIELREETIDGVTVFYAKPAKVAPEFEDNLFIQVHGGAYVVGSGLASAMGAVSIAHFIGMPAVAVDYRMPPEHPFPAAVNDVTTVYKHLLKTRKASSMVIGGGSAGGGLTLASIHKFKELGLELPSAVYAATPWADLTKTSDSLFTNEHIDRFLVTYDGPLAEAAKSYAGDEDMKHPLISPVYGDFSGFPPTHLVAGTRDLFLSDTARSHRALRRAGAIAELHIYEGLSHGEFFSVPNSPETAELFKELNLFLQKYVP